MKPTLTPERLEVMVATIQRQKVVVEIAQAAAQRALDSNGTLTEQFDATIAYNQELGKLQGMLEIHKALFGEVTA